MPPPPDELERVAKQWKVDDEQSYANRQKLLSTMQNLCALNEHLAEWTQLCKTEWEEANRTDEARHAERMEWNTANTGLTASCVPTLKTFNDAGKPGFDSINEQPHWFDTLCIATKASQMAWDAVKDGECDVDLSSTGGKAVDGLYNMLTDSKKNWKAPISATNRAFNWASHGYDASKQRKELEAKLEIGASPEESPQPISHVGPTPLPREYLNDIEFYIRTAATSGSAAGVASMGVKPPRTGVASTGVASTGAASTGAASSLSAILTPMSTLRTSTGVHGHVGVSKKPQAATWWATSAW